MNEGFRHSLRHCEFAYLRVIEAIIAGQALLTVDCHGLPVLAMTKHWQVLVAGLYPATGSRGIKAKK